MYLNDSTRLLGEAYERYRLRSGLVGGSVQLDNSDTLIDSKNRERAKMMGIEGEQISYTQRR